MERVDAREGLNLSIKHPHTDVVDANSLTHGIIFHQDRASIIRLVNTEPLSFWAHVVCAPRVKHQASEYLPFPYSAVMTLHDEIT